MGVVLSSGYPVSSGRNHCTIKACKESLHGLTWGARLAFSEHAGAVLFESGPQVVSGSTGEEKE